MQRCANSVARRRNLHLGRRWDAFGVSSPQLCVFDRNGADLLWCEAGLPKSAINEKKPFFSKEKNGFYHSSELDCTCDFVGTHTSCANVNRFYVAVVFNDFYFLYVGFPFSIRTSTYLGTFDTDSMTCNLAFFTNCTFSHLSAPPSTFAYVT